MKPEASPPIATVARAAIWLCGWPGSMRRPRRGAGSDRRPVWGPM